MLHAAALNLLVRLRAVVADPPALTDLTDPTPDRATVGDPKLPKACLSGAERRRYHNDRAQRDPLGQGHIATWRMMLIKVAGQVRQTERRIYVTLPAQWPHLSWFNRVCERIAALATPATN